LEVWGVGVTGVCSKVDVVGKGGPCKVPAAVREEVKSPKQASGCEVTGATAPGECKVSTAATVVVHHPGQVEVVRERETQGTAVSKCPSGVVEDTPAIARWLAMGTADPHGVGDVDRVKPGRPPALRLGSQSMETGAELLKRPMPVANIPPDTGPRQPAASPTEGAPKVTAVEQVIPAHALVVVSKWRRKLMRCLRAAGRGDLSLARRLRPADVWLEHAANSVPATAAWDWDLRPLERGEPAHPLSTSGKDGVTPATGLVLGVLEHMVAEGLRAKGFVDEAIVSEMISGIEDDSMCRRGTLLCAPHPGGLKSYQQMLKKTKASVDAGWASGGHVALPCWPIRSCPMSVVDESVRAGKPKWRLTTDLSWPHVGAMVVDGVEVDAVNSSMDRSAWPVNRMMRVTEFAEAAAILQSSGVSVGKPKRRVKLWALDCKAYYRIVGRQRSELWRNAVFLEDGVQLDERCCFGDASAATKCARISNVVVWKVRRALKEVDKRWPMRDEEWLQWSVERESLGVSGEHAWVGMFVDDLVGASADDELVSVEGVPRLHESGAPVCRAQAYFDAARGVLMELGWGSEPSKEVGPRDRLDALGVDVDLISERLRLTEAKRERYAVHATEVSKGKVCDGVSFRRLLGRLTSAVQVYPVGRQRLHSAWRASRARYRLKGGAVAVSKAVQQDLLWWAAELRKEGHRGVPLAGVAPTAASHVYADASGEGGWAAWTVADGELLYSYGVWTEEERRLLIICEKELLASTWGLVAFEPWLQQGVVSWTDNTVAMAAMRSMAPRTEVMQAIVARRTEHLFKGEVLEESRRITSKANLWADLGSRGQMAVAVQQAAACGLRGAREVVVERGWRDTTAICALARARDPPTPCRRSGS
jgi:hypothetical protein